MSLEIPKQMKVKLVNLLKLMSLEIPKQMKVKLLNLVKLMSLEIPKQMKVKLLKAQSLMFLIIQVLNPMKILILVFSSRIILNLNQMKTQIPQIFLLIRDFWKNPSMTRPKMHLETFLKK